jgi:hypothetical protein
VQQQRCRFNIQRFRSRAVASLALLGFALSACSDLATQPERRAMAGAAAMERGTLPPGAGQPEGEVGTMGQCGHDAPDCELDPIDVKPPTDNCAENPFGENCGWNGGGGEPPEPPREGEPGGGGSPGGGDPTPPQDNCAEGEECEEGPVAFMACAAAQLVVSLYIGTAAYGSMLDVKAAASRLDEAARNEQMVRDNFNIGRASHDALLLAQSQLTDAQRGYNAALNSAVTVGVAGSVGAIATAAAACLPHLLLPL